MFSRLSLSAGVVAGGILVFIGMQTVNALWIIPERGKRAGSSNAPNWIPNQQSNRRTAR